MNRLRDRLPRAFRVWTLPPDRWGVYYQRRPGRMGWTFHVDHDVVMFKLRLSWQSSKASDRRRYDEYAAFAVASMAAEQERARAEWQHRYPTVAAPTQGGAE